MSAQTNRPTICATGTCPVRPEDQAAAAATTTDGFKPKPAAATDRTTTSTSTATATGTDTQDQPAEKADKSSSDALLDEDAEDDPTQDSKEDEEGKDGLKVGELKEEGKDSIGIICLTKEEALARQAAKKQ